MIVVDNRWTGQNGIGRYANEVLSRLTVPWAPIAPSGSPSSPTDFLFKSVSVNGARPKAVYSPGYNGFLRNVPQTITVLDLIHLSGPGSAKYKPYYDLFLKPLLKRNGHVLTISETSKTEIELWLDDANVEVINAGMGSAPDFTSEGSRFESHRPYFLYVGNLRAHKNVITIAKAIGHLSDSDLYIVTSDRAAAERLAAAQGVSDKVKVFTALDDRELSDLYRGARATLQPSLLEGFGLPTLESALCGTPVIFFEGCKSVREICAGGGISVPVATDPHQWADAMNSIREGQVFPSGVVVQGQYSWKQVAAVVSSTLKSRHEGLLSV